MSNHPIAAGKSSFDLIDPAKLFAVLALTPETILLDAACGVGNYTLAAAEYLGDKGLIIAVDLWSDGIAALRAKAKARGIGNVQAEVADLKALPLEDAAVDVCLLATVLHDLVAEGSEANILREIARVLKPGGKLKIIEFEKIEGPPGPPVAIRLDAGEVEGIVVPFGFRLEQGPVSVGRFNYLTGFVRE